MMAMIVLETLSALCKKIYIGLVMFGCGLAGIPLTFEEVEKL
jgi:hypothetical protein